MTDSYLTWSYEEGRIFDAMPVEQVAFALNRLVRNFTRLFEELPADFDYMELSENSAHEARYIGEAPSRFELYLDDLLPRLLEVAKAPKTARREAYVENFLASYEELREGLRRERRKVTPLKLLLQEHFYRVAVVVWDGLSGHIVRDNVHFLERPFCDLARLRDALFEEWTPEAYEAYMAKADELMALEGYGKWRFHAEREFYSMDHEFPTLEDIQELRDELDVLELWRTRTGNSD